MLAIGLLAGPTPRRSRDDRAPVGDRRFLSASQDIVIDAFRIELLRPEEQGAGAAATQWG